MMNIEYQETQVRLELINAYAKYNYYLEYSDDYVVYIERGNPWNYFKFVNKCVMFPSQNGLSYSTISPRFAKAIYMQMKELGWL